MIPNIAYKNKIFFFSSVPAQDFSLLRSLPVRVSLLQSAIAHATNSQALLLLSLACHLK